MQKREGGNGIFKKGGEEPSANRNLLLGARRKLGKIRPVSIY